MLKSLPLILLFAMTSCDSSAESTVGNGADGGDEPDGDTDGVNSRCPQQVPSDGTDCTGLLGEFCTYERCGTDGIVSVHCTSDDAEGGFTPHWEATIRSCGDVECGNEICGSGEVCGATAGGAFLPTCLVHSCGDGPITCECVCGVLGCSTNTSDLENIQFVCNTCPGGGCP